MTTIKAEEQATRNLEVAGWQIRLSSFRLGDRWHATVESVDADARIARGEGATRNDAEVEALAKATLRLARTRIFHDG